MKTHWMTKRNQMKQALKASAAAVALALTAQAAAADVMFVGSAVTTGDKDRLVFFSSNKPSKAKHQWIQGLQPGEHLLCLDVRPANGQLYAVSTQSQLFTIDASQKIALATPVGTPFAPPLLGDSCGCGFNPNADRLRVVCDDNKNRSVNPDTGVATLQTDVAYVAGDANLGQDPGVVGSDYTNNDNDPATATILYGIDSSRDVLVKQDPPATGQLTTIGSLGVNTIGSQIAGFDILTITTDNNIGYAAMQTPDDDRSKLYSLDLGTGAATFIGKIGGKAVPLRSLAIIGSTP
jgi:hypothetical protein